MKFSELKKKLPKWVRHILWYDPEVGSIWKLKDSNLYVKVLDLKKGRVTYSLLPKKVCKATKKRSAFYELYTQVEKYPYWLPPDDESGEED